MKKDRKKRIVRASKTDKSEPSSHVGTRPVWETQETGFGVTGFGKLSRGSIESWARGVAKPFGRIKPNRDGPGCVCAGMPQCKGDNKTYSPPIRRLSDVNPDFGFIGPVIPKGVGCVSPPDEIRDPRTDANRMVVTVEVRQRLDKFTKGKVRRKAKDNLGPATDIKYQSKPVGKKGTRVRLFTTKQGYNSLPPLPPSGGLSEEELARMREKSIPRD